MQRELHFNSECQLNLNMMSEIMNNAFSLFDTEHKSMKIFENSNDYIAPVPKVVTSSLNLRQKFKKRGIAIVHIEVAVIPIKLVLQKFLSLPNVFQIIMKEYNKCKQNENIISPLQGKLWLKIERKFENKIVLPLIIYYDDLKINNPLGSHRGIHKLGGVYFYIPCIPNEYMGMLDNIFLAQLHNTKDYKTLCNRKIFAEVKNQLLDLEKNGILLKINGDDKRIYFASLSITGDNLGLHEILGFTLNFKHIRACRICTTRKDIREYQCRVSV